VNRRHAATHVGLYRRARHRSVRAKHAAIAGKGLEPFATPFAVIEELAGIGFPTVSANSPGDLRRSTEA
jgi:hypothetical protein